jgi:hypothetical protein
MNNFFKEKNNKIGVIFFHKNIKNIYKERWIKKSIESILNQTYQDFKIYEINYGEENNSIVKEFFPDFNNLDFYFSSCSDHAKAMNFILDRAFEDGCDFVFNTNLDDYYDSSRIEKQLVKLIEGYDIVSSDFCYIEELNGEDTVTFNKNIKSDTDIKLNLDRGHNVIAHPVVAYSKKFWENNRYLPEEIPSEDLNLWKRSINSGFTFCILDDVLLYYRLHQNQITGNNSSSGLNPQQNKNPNPNKNYLDGDNLRNKIYYH